MDETMIEAVPLATLAVAGLGKRDATRTSRVKIASESGDSAALTRGVAALKQHDQPPPVLRHGHLEADQLGLQRVELQQLRLRE